MTQKKIDDTTTNGPLNEHDYLIISHSGDAEECHDSPLRQLRRHKVSGSLLLIL